MRGTIRRRAIPLAAVATLVGALAMCVDPSTAAASFGRVAAVVEEPIVDAPGAISTGGGTSCAVTASRGVRCWGTNPSGLLGSGRVGPNGPEPVDIEGLSSGVARVTVGEQHACALRMTGAVWCWGSRVLGQTGTGVQSATPQTTPAPVEALGSDVVDIDAGYLHTCAVRSDGSVWCWGNNQSRVLGDGTNVGIRSAPVAVVGLVGAVVDIDVGFDHSCVRYLDGDVACWGGNTNGQVGAGTFTSPVVSPTTVTGLPSGAISLAVGGQTSCVRLSDATARCWGEGGGDQLGDGSPTDRARPVEPVGLGAVEDIAPGLRHTCAVRNAAVWCWGDGEQGALGNDHRTSHATPAPTAGADVDAAAVVVGRGYSCALARSGSVRCWGSVDNGRLGTGWHGHRPTPVAVPGISGAIEVTTGGSGIACALVDSGEQRCWGVNTFGGLGDGTTDDRWNPAAVVGTEPSAGGSATGGYHQCSRSTAGGLACWGWGGSGQLGLGGTDDRAVPTPVPGMSTGVSDLSVGFEHSCAVVAGALRCWGLGRSGRLGDGTTTDRPAPTAVTNLESGVAQVAVGLYHTCALSADGSVRCWGSNEAKQVGVVGTTSVLTPQVVSGLPEDVSEIDVGSAHSCAIADGEVWCWGEDRYAQLGDGSGDSSSATPVKVAGIAGAQQLAAGYRHTCARLAGGAVRCWGFDQQGAVGAPGDDPRAWTPRTTISSGATSIDAGPSGEASCASTTSGRAVCWGPALDGQGGFDPGWTPFAPAIGPHRFFTTGEPWHPFPTWDALIARLHVDLLDVAPTSATLNSWKGRLSAGTATKGTLLADLRGSDDHATGVDPAVRLYSAYFLRVPDRGGLRYWIGKRRSGTTVRRISEFFEDSSEFTRRYGALTNEAFVRLIYRNLFDREADANGLLFWTRRLNERRESRGGVMANFSESNEYRRKQTSEVTTSALWLFLLDRAPTPGEYEEAVARLDAGALTTESLALAIVESAEYTDRIS